jgi:RNA polymerase sigma factor (sigma-70 family)
MGTSNDSTRERIRNAARGDRSAVESLIVDLLPALRAFVRLRAGPAVRARDSCSDLVQSVCRELLEDLGSFEYKGDKAFKGWLFTTALRKIVDRARRAEIRGQIGPGAATETEEGPRGEILDVGLGEFLTPSGVALAREEAARLEAAFDLLPDDQREVIVLSRVLGLTFAQIAEQTGRSENAAQKLHARGIARLHVLLSDRRAP